MDRAFALVVVLVVVAMISACPPPAQADKDAGPDLPLVHVEKSGNGRGSITSTPSGIDCDTACDEQNTGFVLPAEGFDVVTLHAEPARDANYFGWSCRVLRGTGDDAEQLFTIDTEEQDVVALDPAAIDGPLDDVEVRCAAELIQVYTLQVFFSGTGSGSVVGTLSQDPLADLPKRVDCPDDCDGAYFDGEQDTLVATPDPGSVFVGWKLDCTPAQGGDPTAPATLTFHEDKNCEAEFAPQ